MARTILSVRGEARRVVEPDHAECRFTMQAVDESPAAALEQVARIQEAAVGALRALGAVALSAESHRAPLRWSVGSVSTWEDIDRGKTRNGRWRAASSLHVACREATRVRAVVEALAEVAGVAVGGVTWGADPDNPGWRLVRADAIAAALARGGDYATALGGRVTSVEHIADQGLLSDGESHGTVGSVSLAMARVGGGESSVPLLDPEPQELRAVIEARLVAEVPDPGA